VLQDSVIAALPARQLSVPPLAGGAPVFWDRRTGGVALVPVLQRLHSLSDWRLVEQTGVSKMQGRLFLAEDRHALLPTPARIRGGVGHQSTGQLPGFVAKLERSVRIFLRQVII
jgi:hypothetical protein